MRNFAQLQADIGQWSLANFGYNETDYLTVVQEDLDTNVVNVAKFTPALDSLAPLMGMMEELGELFEAETVEDAKDAIGDMMIYMADYCCRENIPLPTRAELPEMDRKEADAGMVVYMGHLYHCHLKRHQKIRNMDNPNVFGNARMRALNALVWHIDKYTNDVLSDNLLVLVNETWNKVIKKRDWKADPTQGGGHTHGDDNG